MLKNKYTIMQYFKIMEKQMDNVKGPGVVVIP